MALALSLAKTAYMKNEVPIGAIIVQNNRAIASGYNLKEDAQNPCLHAEIIAIQSACRILGTWRLRDCSLYTTLEPCLMCAGAISQARIKEVFYATPDLKGGACGSLYEIGSDQRLNHNFKTTGNICANEASSLLKEFFQRKRLKPRN